MLNTSVSAHRLGLVVLCLGGLLLSLVAPVSAEAPGPQFTLDHPGAEPWQQVPREEVGAECGLDPDLLDQADTRFPQSSYVIVRFGKLCWTSGGSGPSTTQPYSVQSVTKTMGATLVGLAAARSSLADTDFVSWWLSPSQARVNPHARVAHVLGTTAMSPLLFPDMKAPWTYDILGYREIDRLRDTISAVIKREPENFPGVQNVYALARQELFEPLGMQDTSWTSGGFGFGMTSSTRDLARLGLLLLRKGNWGGVQLLEEDYVYRMTHPSFADANPGYGYLTWLNSQTMKDGAAGTNPDNNCAPYSTWPRHPHPPFYETTHNYGGSPFAQHPHDIGVFFAAGLGGQYSIVHRGLDMVIAARDATGSGGAGAHQLLWDAIRPALLAHDAEYGIEDEASFCAAYRSSSYAPTLVSPW